MVFELNVVHKWCVGALEGWKVRRFGMLEGEGLHGVPECEVEVGAFWSPVRYVRGQETRAHSGVAVDISGLQVREDASRTTCPGRFEVPVM